MLEFEWDDRKAEANFNKHGIKFSEAVTVWLDDNSLEISDPEHGINEDRWLRMGFSRFARILVVVYVEKIEGELLRIISARRATSKEKLQYQLRGRNER